MPQPARRGLRPLRGAAAAIATLAVGATLLVFLEPPGGYGTTLVGLVDPVGQSRLVTVEDVQARAVEFDVDFFGFRYQGNTSNLIDAHTYYFGAYEKPELFFLRDTLLALGGEAVVVDVGANTGLHALFASRYAKQVHAFEPYPPVVARLRRFIDDNGVANVTVHPVGLGEAAAVLPFFPPPDNNLGTGSFVGTSGSGDRDGGEDLRIVAGDAYFQTSGLSRVDLVKMDIEGYEKPALAGLRQVLQRERPVVLLEVTVDPAAPGLFASMDEFRSVFPENYEFLSFAERDLRSGAYELQPLQLSFAGAVRLNVVARPQ